MKVPSAVEVRLDQRTRGTRARGARQARDTWGRIWGQISLSPTKSGREVQFNRGFSRDEYTVKV